MLFRSAKARERERARRLAWAAQMVIATRAPFSVTVGGPPRRDAETAIGESLVDSEAIHQALVGLAVELGPGSPLADQVLETAAFAVKPILDLRPSWMRHCDREIPSDVDDGLRAMYRTWVAPETVRRWPHYQRAKEAVDAAVGPLDRLQQELARVCGHDVTTLVRARAAEVAR